jgi:hypothetical protein
MRLATAQAQKLYKPLLPLQAVKPESGGRVRRNSPAGRGGIGLARERFFRRIAPASQHKGGYAGLPRAKLKASGGREREPRDFTHDTGKPGASQTFLHGRQHIPVVPCFAVNDTIGRQPDASERRSEQIAPAQTPQYRAGKTRQNSRNEQRGNAGIFTGRTVLDHFV